VRTVASDEIEIRIGAAEVLNRWPTTGLAAGGLDDQVCERHVSRRQHLRAERYAREPSSSATWG